MRSINAYIYYRRTGNVISTTKLLDEIMDTIYIEIPNYKLDFLVKEGLINDTSSEEISAFIDLYTYIKSDNIIGFSYYAGDTIVHSILGRYEVI